MSVYLHQRLTKTLLLEMVSGMYRNGQRFLSLREIRRIWKVSDPTIMTSLRTLTEENLLKSRLRSGHYLVTGFQDKALLCLKKTKGKPLLPSLSLSQKLKQLEARAGGKVAFLLESKYKPRTTDESLPQTIFQKLPDEFCSPSVIRCAKGFEKECARYQFEVEYLLYSNGTEDNGEWVKERLEIGAYSGIAVFCRNGYPEMESMLHTSIQNQIPIVVLYDDCQGLPVASINLNNVGIGYDAVRQLYRQGHRRITVLASKEGREEKIQQNRVKGALLIASEESCKDIQLQVFWVRLHQPCPAALRRHFTDPRQRPTALLICKSDILTKLSPLFQKLKLGVPDDLSLIVCSSRSYASSIDRPMDTMQLNVATRIGRIAARQLHLIQSGEPLEKNVLINVRQIRRGSVRSLESG